jgi:hypothetical protein
MIKAFVASDILGGNGEPSAFRVLDPAVFMDLQPVGSRSDNGLQIVPGRGLDLDRVGTDLRPPVSKRERAL